MFCVDYLIANRDRHGSNLEILRERSSGSVRLAPLFDQGVSMLFSTYGDEHLIKKADVMQDFPVNNFIGSRSLEYNLTLIPDNAVLGIYSLKPSDKDYIFDGIDQVLSENHIKTLWKMFWQRWCHYEKVCNKEG